MLSKLTHTETKMTTYVIVLLDRITDRQEFETYGKLAALAREGHAMTMLALHSYHEVLEGQPVEGAVVFSFPSPEEAKTWYNSPAYQKALPHRLKAAESRVLMVEGI
jgi:uncharacterized protein (DUF1330 family)